MAPEAPAIPTFPTLSWAYSDGRYSLNEADADALLDYGENELPLFAHRYDQFLRQIRLILDGLAQP
jgi:chromosome condensin MukBEF MukE localization factor